MPNDIQLSKHRKKLAGERVYLPDEECVSKQEAAELLGGRTKPVSISTINVMLARKVLPKIRLSYRLVRIPKRAVLDYIARRTINSQGAK
jgi:hypothetical protein